MPRRYFKRYAPDQEKIRRCKALRIFGERLHDPNLWHLNRRSVSSAFFIGIFWCFQPLPSQMVAAAATAMVLRANLPLSAALVWITNPITIPPVFYFVYLVGHYLLGRGAQELHFDFTLDSLMANFGAIWEPLVLGGLVCGLVFGAIGYLAIRGFWRWHVLRHLKRRRARRYGSGTTVNKAYKLSDER
jgi:uncharacterized protein (DUF2062 family)